MKCQYCGYEWTAKKENPVACPRCKSRLDRPRRVVGLQIGGTVGPNDSVGMYVPIPIKPGVGVNVQLDNEFDKEIKTLSEKIPSDHPKATEIHNLVDDILTTKEKNSKLQKISTLVMIGAGVTQIATEISKITKLLGF